MIIPIAEIGEIQEKDILKSSGVVLYNGVSRICTVVKPGMAFDDRGDKSPLRMAELFGGNFSIIPKERIDFLKVIDYEVTKSRR